MRFWGAKILRVCFLFGDCIHKDDSVLRNLMDLLDILTKNND